MLSARTGKKPLPNKGEFREMRRFDLCFSSFLTAGLMLAATVTPSTAAEKPYDASASARVVSVPIPAGAVKPESSYAGLAEATVTVGLETLGVPCGECVPGVSGNNIGLPWPLFTVSQGETLSVSTWFESTLYSGACTAEFIMKQGTTVVASGVYPFPGGCTPGYLYGVFFTVPVPTTTGFTTVIGSIHGGPNTSGVNTFLNVQ